MTMKQSQYYGGSDQEALDGRRGQEARQRAIRNGYTIRYEKRGREPVLVIVIEPKEAAP